MLPKLQNQYGFFTFPKKKAINNKKKSQNINKELKWSRDDGLSSVSTEPSIFDDDMNSSIHTSSFHTSSTHSSVTTNTQPNCDSINSSPLSHKINTSLYSRSSSHGRETTKGLKRKKVVFDDNKTQLNFYESFESDPSDIWWSKGEVKQRQIDNRRVLLAYNQEELQRIRQYATAYHNARQKSIISKHQQQENGSIDISSKTKVNISMDDYQVIVRGKAEGLDGLEKVFTSKDIRSLLLPSEKIATNRKFIIMKIIASYKDMIHNNNINKRVDGSRRITSNDVDRQIRSISKTLTSCDRSWAVVMGNSDRDALLEYVINITSNIDSK